MWGYPVLLFQFSSADLRHPEFQSDSALKWPRQRMQVGMQQMQQKKLALMLAMGTVGIQLEKLRCTVVKEIWDTKFSLWAAHSKVGS